MSYFKRFLLLGGIGVFLLAGLMLASSTRVSSTAFANGCNSVATGLWENNCTVSQGNISNFVYAIQVAINTSGARYNGQSCGGLAVDGDFGASTETAVKCFQGWAGLSQDGIVGPQTWNALGGVLVFDHDNAGWQYDHELASSATDFRVWISSGIWYVHVSSDGEWCQMNLSSPC